MKKRHEQKLVILALTVATLFNMPFVQIFNSEGHVFGIPNFYFIIFIIWLVVIIVSYLVLKRHYE